MYKNLKALRQSLNMSQKEFAASLDIGYTTYNGYETGARDPKSDFWIKVARKYNVTIDYLMGFSDSAWARAEQQIRDTSSPSVLGEPLTSPMQRAVDAMGELNQEGQERVADYAEDLEASGRYI